MILVFVLWITKYRLVLPVNSMAKAAGDFAFSDEVDDEVEMERNLSRVLDLKIATDDEIEALYNAFCRMTEDTVSYMKDIRTQNESILRLQNGLIMSMADMVEGRDSDTGNHVRKTAAYCRIIMEGLRRKGYYSDQLTDKFIYDVERSAPLHDIGKIAISDVILNKPGKLTDEEFEIMKTHTTEGKKLLDRVIESVEGESYLVEGRNLAAYHHEKWNGRGYPEGLSGEDIPLSARVMAIADVFDALTSKRVYKDAMPFEKAVSIIQEDAGTHFDPKCVEAFTASLDEFRAVMERYKDADERVLQEVRERLENARPKRDAW
jgi:response regulator RpfG family c-di-GMP phosphodiesterase